MLTDEHADETPLQRLFTSAGFRIGRRIVLAVAFVLIAWFGYRSFVRPSTPDVPAEHVIRQPDIPPPAPDPRAP